MRKNKNLNKQTKKEMDIFFLRDRSGSMKGIEKENRYKIIIAMIFNVITKEPQTEFQVSC